MLLLGRGAATSSRIQGVIPSVFLRRSQVVHCDPIGARCVVKGAVVDGVVPQAVVFADGQKRMTCRRFHHLVAGAVVGVPVGEVGHFFVISTN